MIFNLRVDVTIVLITLYYLLVYSATRQTNSLLVYLGENFTGQNTLLY